MKLSFLLVALVFMGTSIGVTTSYSGQFMPSGDHYDYNTAFSGNLLTENNAYQGFDRGTTMVKANTPGSNKDTNLLGAGIASISNSLKVLCTIKVGKFPGRVAYDSSNEYIYTVNLGSNTTSVINGTTNKVIKNITVGKCPVGVTYDGSNGYIYVANFGSSNISVINPSTGKVIQNINVGKSPCTVAIDGSNGNLYVPNRYSNNVSVINGTTNKVVHSITVGKHPVSATFSVSSGYVYVTNCCNSNVSVINGTTNKVVHSIAVGTEPVSIMCDISNRYLYVSNYGSNNMSVINTSTNRVIQNINLGGFPNQAAFDSSNGYLYVANSGSNNLSVINTSTEKVIQSVNVGQHPFGVAFDSSNGNVYVTNCCSNSVSVLGYVKYAVTFTETGLPTGSIWYVNTTGHNSGALTGITYSVNLTNGTFAYTVQTNNKQFEPSTSSGYLMVNGKAVLKTIMFSHVYKVTFTETGLPSGTIWYGNVTNSTGHIFHGSSSTNTIAFNLINGTYTFTNSTSDKIYGPSSHSGKFTVSGSAVNLPTVSFSQITYKVTFMEIGLPTGSIWYVNITGHDSGLITGTTYSVMLTNGTYAYTLGTNNTNYNANGSTILINGHFKTVSVTFTVSSSLSKGSHSGIPNIDLYNIIGVVAAAIAIGSLIFIMRRKK